MRDRRAAAGLGVLLIVAVACGSGAPLAPTSTSGDSSVATTSPASSGTSVTPLPSTSTTSGSSDFPDAGSPEAIPWADVGTGWLLVRYRRPPGPPERSDDSEALFLIAPEGTWYLVGEWSGGLILDWSPTGRRALAFADGTLGVADLEVGEITPVPNLVYGSDAGTFEFVQRWARFIRPSGDVIAVRLLDLDAGRVRLVAISPDGTLVSDLVDLSLGAIDLWDPSAISEGVSWLSTPNGVGIVTTTSDGIRLLDNSGDIIRELDAPGLACVASRWWDEESLLATCVDTGWAASPCWARGPVGPGGGRALWSVPLDGSGATRLTPEPICIPETGSPEFWAENVDAASVGDVIAVQTVTCCACYGGLDLIHRATITHFAGYPGVGPSCRVGLVGPADRGVLVYDLLMQWDDRAETTSGAWGALFEVTPDGAVVRTLNPIHLGETGGIVQVFTTEETNLLVGSW